MSGWNTIQRIRHVEEQISRLGFKFSKSKHGDFTELHGSLSLVPRDVDALPMYTRDAELFVGSVERLEDWLAGVQWAREYDSMLGLSSVSKRATKEEQERGRQLIAKLKKDHTNGTPK